MTNGEMIKSIFPSAEIDIGNGGNDIWIAIDCWTIFKKEWWNAEYKEPTTKNDLGVDRENAVERLNALKQLIGYDKDSEIVKATQKSLDLAIKALEQESILDKIRAEIESIDLLAEYTRGDIKRMALDVIDKRRAESEA